MKQLLILLITAIPLLGFSNIEIKVNNSVQNGVCSGVIEIIANGNTGPYQVDLYWQEASTTTPWMTVTITEGSHIFYDLSLGHYNATVTSAFGCITELSAQVECGCTLTLGPPKVFHPTTCQSTDGGMTYWGTAGIQGGVGPYIYEWSNGYQTFDDPSQNNMSHGRYSLTVTDAWGCTASAEFELVGQNAPEISEIIEQPCEGLSNGSIALIATGSVGPYEWEWDHPDVFVDGSITIVSDLPEGEYCYQLYDASTGCNLNGCIVLIEIPDCGEYEILTSEVQIIKSCPEQPTGSLYIPVTGGNPINADYSCDVGFYRTRWYDADGNLLATNLNNTLKELWAGTYHVEIEDKCDRVIEASFEIEAHPLIEATLIPMIGCPGEGTLELTNIQGGAGGPYTFEWMDFPEITLNKLEGLFEGDYGVNITDGAGCTRYFEAFVPNYPDMTLSLEVFEPCFIPEGLEQYHLFAEDLQDGNINLTVTWTDGNTQNATYQWNDFDQSTTQDLNGIGFEDFEFDSQDSKTFTVIVTDANGCTKSASTQLFNNATFEKDYNETQCFCDINVLCDGISISKEIMTTEYYKECDVWSLETCNKYECMCNYPDIFENIPPLHNEYPLKCEDEEVFLSLEVVNLPNCEVKHFCPDFAEYPHINTPFPFDLHHNSELDPCFLNIISLNPNPNVIDECSTLEFELPEGGGDVTIEVFDSGGNSIIIQDNTFNSGLNSVDFCFSSADIFRFELTFNSETSFIDICVHDDNSTCDFTFDSVSPNPFSSDNSNVEINYTLPVNGGSVTIRSFEELNNPMTVFNSITVNGLEGNNTEFVFADFFANNGFNAVSVEFNGEELFRTCIKLDNFDGSNSTELRLDRNIEEKIFLVYPNPSNGNFTIRNRNNLVIRQIQVYNETGKVVLNKKMNHNDSRLGFNTNTLNSGLYLLKIQTENDLFIEKIIINK